MDREALLDVAARVRNCIRCPLAETRTHAVPGEGAGVFGHVALGMFGATQETTVGGGQEEVVRGATEEKAAGDVTEAKAAGDATEAKAAGGAMEEKAAGSAVAANAVGQTAQDSAVGGAAAGTAGERDARPPAWSGLMLVGEAPGRNEDETGRPFCGAAGKNLDLGLAAARLRREEVFVTSINKCRPPNNRDPRPAEKAACRPYLMEQVAALRPRLLVALGRHGLSGLVAEAPKQFSEVRGRFVEGPLGPDGHPVPVFCSLHPAAIIYRQAWRQTYLEDWERLGAWLRGEAVDGFPPLRA